MASIINQKVNNDHIVLSLKLSKNETKALNGFIDNLHIVSDAVSDN